MDCNPKAKFPARFRSSSNHTFSSIRIGGLKGFPCEPETRQENLAPLCGQTVSTVNILQRKYRRGVPLPVISQIVSPTLTWLPLSVCTDNSLGDTSYPILLGL